MGGDDPTIGGLSPPAFLQLVGNPVRWRVLTELARSDLRVGELTALVGQPQNTVSYHLGRLRGGGLVSTRRSSADHRDSYYHLELTRVGELLAATGAALHPGLALSVPLSPAPGPARGPATVGRHQVVATVSVLFLCTGNSARSPIAEAILTRAAGRVTVDSAGSNPKDLHPNAVDVMRDYGIDLSGRRSKHVDELSGRRFDYVITLCDRVREVCPRFPHGPELIHWSIPDPSAEEAGAQEAGRDSYPAFRRVAAELHTRIGFFTHRIATPTTKG